VTGILRDDILGEAQRRFLDAFRDSALASRFYLTGGTTLAAFYLRHRYSEDLDFFCPDDFEVEEILGWLRSLSESPDIRYERKYDRRLFLLTAAGGRALKVEFTKYPFPHIEPVRMVDGLKVDSLPDILANKMIALTDRRDPKDFVDLYCALVGHPELSAVDVAAAAERKFGVSGIRHILQRRFLEALPSPKGLRMCGPFDPEAMTRFFRELARSWLEPEPS
jgi:predicted nucleotidyltransferase component of viral defense system